MATLPAYPLRIFYDGSCAVCGREMAIYQRKEHGGSLVFVDISAPEFDPTLFGITIGAFMHEMHAIDSEGHVYRGVEAFRVIWQAFPASTWCGLLGTLVTLPGIKQLARVAYWCFARIRVYLPGRRNDCKDGTCHIDRHSPHP